MISKFFISNEHWMDYASSRALHSQRANCRSSTMLRSIKIRKTCCSIGLMSKRHVPIPTKKAAMDIICVHSDTCRYPLVAPSYRWSYTPLLLSPLQFSPSGLNKSPLRFSAVHQNIGATNQRPAAKQLNWFLYTLMRVRIYQEMPNCMIPLSRSPVRAELFDKFPDDMDEQLIIVNHSKFLGLSWPHFG